MIHKYEDQTRNAKRRKMRKNSKFKDFASSCKNLKENLQNTIINYAGYIKFYIDQWDKR